MTTTEPGAGDLTFEAGFLITAVIYLAWRVFPNPDPSRRTDLE